MDSDLDYFPFVVSLLYWTSFFARLLMEEIDDNFFAGIIEFLLSFEALESYLLRYIEFLIELNAP